jgi:hypothetical protein
MKLISSLIPVALLFGATTLFGASTDCPAAAESVSRTADSSANAAIAAVPAAAVPAAAVPGAASAGTASPASTSPEARSITSDQILERLFGRRSDDRITSGTAGSKLLDLQGRFSLVTIIVRKPDGTIGHFCVDNIDAARKLLAGPASPAAVPVAAQAPPLQ